MDKRIKLFSLASFVFFFHIFVEIYASVWVIKDLDLYHREIVNGFLAKHELVPKPRVVGIVLK